jgi:hypothetical protein
MAGNRIMLLAETLIPGHLTHTEPSLAHERPLGNLDADPLKTAFATALFFKCPLGPSRNSF